MTLAYLFKSMLMTLFFVLLMKIFAKKFAKLMEGKYEMSMMCELTYFLGLQVKQVKDDIFINQTKYIYDLLRKFDLTDCSSSRNTPWALPLSLS